MARIFLDTNVVFALIKDEVSSEVRDSLDHHQLLISPLTVHILCYVLKIKLPDPKFSQLMQHFVIIDIDRQLHALSLVGPTRDYEDNLQLNSALAGSADIFLTLDKQLLQLKKINQMVVAKPQFILQQSLD